MKHLKDTLKGKNILDWAQQFAFKETARNAVDQVRSLPDKAKKFSKATALAVLMAVGGAAATDAASQTTYIDTIPEEHKNLCLVYVTDDLLETLEMTSEEFYEQKVIQDFDWLSKSHYYSGNTNDTNQIVEIVAGDQVQELSTEGLPDEMRSSDANAYLQNKEDGVWENVDQDMECFNPHSVVLYGKFSNSWSNNTEYISIDWRIQDGMPRSFILQHENWHRLWGWHFNSPVREKNTWPTEIDSITPRHEEFAEYRDAPISAEERLLGKRTVMNAGQKVGIYSSPEIRTPDSESNMTKVVRDKLLELNTENPLLKAEILAPADSLEVNEMATLEADLNRDEIE